MRGGGGGGGGVSLDWSVMLGSVAWLQCVIMFVLLLICDNITFWKAAGVGLVKKSRASASGDWVGGVGGCCCCDDIVL